MASNAYHQRKTVSGWPRAPGTQRHGAKSCGLYLSRGAQPNACAVKPGAASHQPARKAVVNLRRSSATQISAKLEMLYARLQGLTPTASSPTDAAFAAPTWRLPLLRLLMVSSSSSFRLRLYRHATASTSAAHRPHTLAVMAAAIIMGFKERASAGGFWATACCGACCSPSAPPTTCDLGYCACISGHVGQGGHCVSPISKGQRTRMWKPPRAQCRIRSSRPGQVSWDDTRHPPGRWLLAGCTVRLLPLSAVCWCWSTRPAARTRQRTQSRRGR